MTEKYTEFSTAKQCINVALQLNCFLVIPTHCIQERVRERWGGGKGE